MKKVFALVAVLALATAAQAAIIQTVELTGNAGGKMFIDVDSLGTITTDAGVLVDLYDIYFRGDGSPNGQLAGIDFAATGQLYQVRWAALASRITPDEFYANADFLMYPEQETHFTLNYSGEDWVTNKAPKENNDGSLEPVDEIVAGWGTYLGAIVGIQPSVQSLPGGSLKLMHLALATGTTAELASGIFPGNTYAYGGKVSDGTGEVFNVDGVVLGGEIPEPATIGLLVLGGLGALVRRNRR